MMLHMGSCETMPMGNRTNAPGCPFDCPVLVMILAQVYICFDSMYRHTQHVGAGKTGATLLREITETYY